ncbi:argonaute-like protein [Coniophora puteana RWD-64-598 SS2]|uniref:Argonaute-like protein n=1 Tax=Coniophora puteana (strain RWD-64-598) TaxID=741705 RepID=A0A5M3MZS0_CONPW|nr:argonaute-like protein [Coniophora puteana RWD-64-598 SS2]EIW84628.1 argonaute-like protein [Coniophora puteana RWD-64-598 SS2]
MPPRASASSRGRGRGAPRGGPSPRAGTPTRGRGPAAQGAAGLPADHVTAVGVKRPGFGTSGQHVVVSANFYEVSIPEEQIHHYNAFLPSEDIVPERVKRYLIDHLQAVIAPHIFVKKSSYDGNQNLFSPQRLAFVPGDSAEFTITFDGGTGPNSNPGANISQQRQRPYKIRLKKVQTINYDIVHRFVAGQQSPDSRAQTALTAMNVVIRMEPKGRLTYNRRSLFAPNETRYIGGGIILWRGIFQSIRPAIEKIFVNIDISTGTMVKPGPLLSLCLEFLDDGRDQLLHPQHLSTGLSERDRRRLEKFVFGIGVHFTHSPRGNPRAIRGLTTAGASDTLFTLRNGEELTVTSYFRDHHNLILQYPDVFCVKIGQGAMVPMELCTVPPGQLLKQYMPSNKIDQIRKFSTLDPAERLRSIKDGISILAHGQSEYVRHAGMTVNSEAGPTQVNARVLPTPTMMYASSGKIPRVIPQNGTWDMRDKTVIQPATINSWFVAIFDTQRRFTWVNANEMVKNLVKGCQDIGIVVKDISPSMKWLNGQGNIHNQLNALYRASTAAKKKEPTFAVVVLPEYGNDIYVKVKNFGDVEQGVATQCMKSYKCVRASAWYYAQVCLKINVKLGGINTILDTQLSTDLLSDPGNPTVVISAKVMHPGPGSDHPSFTAMAGSLDPDAATYTATSRIQSSRMETIEPNDFQAMAKYILTMYREYNEMKAGMPKSYSPSRIYFYRDGISKGQFQQILDLEIPALKAACQALGMRPKITMIIVAKGHHTRLFPNKSSEADKSGNCLPGTVVDRTIVSPVEWDWYLQSHAGITNSGTSRPAHYNVIYDENNSTPDGLQALSYALCHVYAPATRSVSVPAPVYYARNICSRAKSHFNPDTMVDLLDTPSSDSTAILQRYVQEYKPIHSKLERVMYWS